MNALLKSIETPHGISAFAPGIYPAIPAEVYHRRELGVVNNGALKILSSKTAAHYRAWVESGDEESTKALAFGQALHCAVLQSEVFEATYVEPVEHPFRRPSSAQRNAKKPSQSTLDAIAYWNAWEAEHAGLIDISIDEKRRLQGMADSIRRDPYAGPLFRREGVAEETMVWIDPRTGLLCKARNDYHIPSLRTTVDLKSTEDASDEAFKNSIARYGYHIQHAHYASGSAALGRDLDAFLLVAVEKEPPYAVVVHCIDAEFEGIGIELRDRAMDKLAHCLASNTWPAYAPGIHRLSAPRWALAA